MAGESVADSSSSKSPEVGFAHRLVRTLSGRAVASPARSSGTAPNALPEVDEGTTAAVSPDSEHTATLETKKQGLLTGIIDRFKDLGVSLGLSGSTTSGPTSSSYPDIAANNEAISSSEAAPNAGPSQVASHQDGVVRSEADPAEPLTLAEKIRSMIEALPLPTSPRSPTSKKPKPPKHDASGRPIPPPGATPIKDSKLISMLSSPTIMNGGRPGERERRISVFSVLDSLGTSRPDDDDEIEDGGDGPDGGGDRTDDSGSVFHDTSGIMMYSPLIPTSDSLVEIADSGIVSPPVEQVDISSEAAQLAGWMGMWPFSALGGGVGQVPGVSPTSPVAGNTTVPMSPPGSPRTIRIRAQRVWVPSTTKLSFQAMWWGYKIYLPPPVMDILDDKQIEAAKRAALITTALTWFFSNIPLTALPPAVRPPLLLLQTLVPYLGYIGTFISWSWGTVKSYDAGFGVILTATWLLPIALIPGTWGGDDFPPPSPPEQVPTPLPPNSPPTQPPSSLPPANPPASPPSSPTNPPASSPPATDPPPPPTSPPSGPPSSPPTSPPPETSSPSVPPASSPEKLPIQKPIGTPANTAPVPTTHEPSAQSPQVLSPLSIWSPVHQASEPLPSWVPPPPPPSPPKIPLPDLEDETASVASPSPRFGRLGVLQVGRGKDKDKSRGGDKDKEQKKKTKLKFKAMVSAPFSSSSKKGLEG